MGKQHNKVEKRSRRLSYVKRKKEEVKAQIVLSKKSAKKAPAKAAKKGTPSEEVADEATVAVAGEDPQVASAPAKKAPAKKKAAARKTAKKKAEVTTAAPESDGKDDIKDEAADEAAGSED